LIGLKKDKIPKQQSTARSADLLPVKPHGQGVRIGSCCLPVKSPWFSPIEPKWVPGKQDLVEPARLLNAQEVAEQVCTHLGYAHEEHLSLSDRAA
jgi:hypothetical protein